MLFFNLQLIMNTVELIKNILNLGATSCLSVSFSYFFYKILNEPILLLQKLLNFFVAYFNIFLFICLMYVIVYTIIHYYDLFNEL